MGKHVGCLFGVLLIACGSAREVSEAPTQEHLSAPEEPAPPELEPDPSVLPTTIDGLVERFNGSHGLWLNGLSPTLDFPETSPRRRVLHAMFQVVSFDDGAVTEFEILEERVVQIDGDDYNALRLMTNLGPKIVLMRYRSSEWWTRIYEGREP